MAYKFIDKNKINEERNNLENYMTFSGFLVLEN